MKKVVVNSEGDSSGIRVNDVLYVIFKHKWKIIAFTLCGLFAAGLKSYRSTLTPSFETQAKLLVRYVVERSVSDPEAPTTAKGGGNVIDTEREILTSWDLAKETASKVGPERLVPHATTRSALDAAAGVIVSGLLVESERGSNVLRISYRGPEPSLSVDVLTELIQVYFERHLEIHRSTNAINQVRTQALEAERTLRATESAINALKSKHGIISMEGTVADFENRRLLVRSALMETKSSLAEQGAKVAALEKAQGARDLGNDGMDGPDERNITETAEDPATQSRLADAASILQDLNDRMVLLRQERNRMLLRRPPTDPTIKSLEAQISALTSEEKRVIRLNPELLRTLGTNLPGRPVSVVSNLDDERALEAAIAARAVAIEDQARGIESQVEDLSRLGFQLEDLERRRQMEEERYRYFQSSVEKATVDGQLDPSMMPNISVVQEPSPPHRSMEAGTQKIVMGLAASGLMFGLALAFLIEYVIDPRISRPADVETRFRLPLMLSIPYMRIAKHNSMNLISGDNVLHISSGSSFSPAPPPLPVKSSRLRTQDRGRMIESPGTDGYHGEHFISPFARAIHDRILFNFEINNVTHKPKVLGLTALARGAGTSTLSLGVAKAFSEGSQQKVLLIDLNPRRHASGSRDHPLESLKHALEVSRNEGFRSGPGILIRVHAPTRQSDSCSGILAPSSLYELMPHLSSSSFDYVIFDMPPLEATSPTVAIAGFMDKVLLVLDAESTTPDKLKWACSELERGRADVSCIFNKVRSYAPSWIQGGH
jgi:polysaccharide biosynthesis transport protein